MITASSNRFAAIAHPRNAVFAQQQARGQQVGSYELRLKL